MSASNVMRSLHAPAMTSRTRLFPAWLAQEWFFWVVFAAWTILPPTLIPFWDVAGIPVKSTDALTIPLCLLYAAPRIFSPCRWLPKAWHLWLPGALLALAAWGMISTYWSDIRSRDVVAMWYCMVVSAASGVLAYFVVSSVSDVRGFLWRLVIALSCVCCLYTAQSYLGLNASAKTLDDFGIERVRGPLFEASTGYFLLIPAMAFALQEALARRVKPLHGLGCVFCLALTTIGLGSRAGLILFGLFILSCAWAAKGRTKIIAVAVVLVIGAAGAAVIFTKAKADRLLSKEKNLRSLTHEAVVGIMMDRSPAQLLTGSGLGSWWPWYLTETEGGDLYAGGLYIRHTRYGILLYHSHSTVLTLVVEMGLLGLVFLLWLAAALFTALRKAWRTGPNRIFAAGILVSVFSIGFDLFLVRRPTRDAVWWLFVFGLLALLGREYKGGARRHA